MEGVAIQVQLEVGRQYQVIPSFVDSKCTENIFSIQLAENEDILDLIQQYCNDLNNDVIAVDPDKIVPHAVCIAKYDDDDASYYRGFIETVDKTKGKATITFFDYGNTEDVSIQDIAQIPEMVRTFVPQAYLCEWKHSTKKGLYKLYNSQCDEVEILVKVISKRYDERARSMIYSVCIPALEVVEEKAAELKAVGPVGSGTENVLVKEAVPAPSVLEAEELTTLANTLLKTETVKEPERHVNAPPVASALTINAASNPIQLGSTSTSTTIASNALQLGKLESTSPIKAGLSSSVATMTIPLPHGQQMQNGAGASNAGTEIGPSGMKEEYNKKFEECATLLKTDLEFFDVMCTMYASFMTILDKKEKK